MPVDSCTVDEFPEWHGRINSLQRSMCQILNRSEKRLLGGRQETARKLEDVLEHMRNSAVQIDELRTELREIRAEREQEKIEHLEEMAGLKFQLRQVDDKLKSDLKTRSQMESQLAIQNEELKSQVGKLESAIVQLLQKFDQTESDVQDDQPSTSEVIEETET